MTPDEIKVKNDDIHRQNVIDVLKNIKDHVPKDYKRHQKGGGIYHDKGGFRRGAGITWTEHRPKPNKDIIFIEEEVNGQPEQFRRFGPFGSPADRDAFLAHRQATMFAILDHLYETPEAFICQGAPIRSLSTRQLTLHQRTMTDIAILRMVVTEKRTDKSIGEYFRTTGSSVSHSAKRGARAICTHPYRDEPLAFEVIAYKERNPYKTKLWPEHIFGLRTVKGTDYEHLLSIRQPFRGWPNRPKTAKQIEADIRRRKALQLIVMKGISFVDLGKVLGVCSSRGRQLVAEAVRQLSISCEKTGDRALAHHVLKWCDAKKKWPVDWPTNYGGLIIDEGKVRMMMKEAA